MLSELLKRLAAILAGDVRDDARASHANQSVTDGSIEQQRARALAAYCAGHFAVAQDLYRQVIHSNPDDHDALHHLGVMQARAGNYEVATEFLLCALEINPEAIDTINALANVARLQERWCDAEALYRRALLVDPSAAAVWANLGLCLREAGEPDAAVKALLRALELNPDHPEALLNLGLVRIDDGTFEEARALLRRALEVEPGMAEAHTAFAHLLLQQGDFKNGWPQYEWRFLCADANAQRTYPYPRWDGAPIPDGVLVVRGEQGLGDQIMLASCLPDAMSRAGHCIVECDQRLVGLFARSFPGASFFPHLVKREPLWMGCDRHPDYQIFLGGLAGLFRTKRSDFPRHQGYLRADPARVEIWRTRLSQLGPGLNIGISWRGGAPRTRRHWRSIPLAAWLPVLDRSDVSFVSLQYGPCQSEIDALKHDLNIRLMHWQQAIDDYEETAALVAALDLVISVQTAVVHLAGALGKRAWVMVPAVPEWRYMQSGEAMPWYPSMRLFRQQHPGNWQSVLDRVAAELRTVIAAA